jgi:hypothetical protein
MKRHDNMWQEMFDLIEPDEEQQDELIGYLSRALMFCESRHDLDKSSGHHFPESFRV